MKFKYLLLALFSIFLLWSCGDDNTSNPPVGIPAVPMNLRTESGESEVVLTWDAVSGAESYNVYYSDKLDFDKTNSTKIAGVKSPYSAKNLTNMKLYYFAVSAVNSGGESELSEKATGMPSAPAKGNWEGISDTGKATYVELKMNLNQTGIVVSGTVNLKYYKDKALSESTDYACSGTITNSNIQLVFTNAKYVNDYIGTVMVATQRMSGTLSIAQLINGEKVTETFSLILKKTQ